MAATPKPPVETKGKVVVIVSGPVKVTSTTPGVVVKRKD